MSVDKELILQKIREIAQTQNVNKLQRNKFTDITGISQHQLYKYFTTWEEAVKEAGISSYARSKASTSDLFLNMKDVFEHKGGVCKRRYFELEYGKLSKYGPDAYRRHFGRWENVLLEFRK